MAVSNLVRTFADDMGKTTMIMRKAIMVIMMMMVCVAVQAQTVIRTDVLKKTDLGNQRLEATREGNDTTYVMLIATGNRFKSYVDVVLGGKTDALRMLQFLLDAEISGDDVITLDNPTNNLVKKNTLGGYRVFSEGRQLSGQLRKPNIKAFIKAIHQYCGD